MNETIFTQIAELYKLKEVYRDTIVKDRQESTAEHTWSILVLADYFLETYKFDLDRKKIYQLIIYHDLTEIKIGDIPLIKQSKKINKKEMEHEALKEIKSELPENFGSYVEGIIEHYEERKSKESKFVKAVDYIDNEFTCLAYNYDYKKYGYSKQFLKDKYIEKVNSFKQLDEFYFKLLDYLTEKGLLE